MIRIAAKVMWMPRLESAAMSAASATRLARRDGIRGRFVGGAA
jgi:hypothetical protein